jgi:hypothetical protein
MHALNNGIIKFDNTLQTNGGEPGKSRQKEASLTSTIDDVRKSI